MSNLEESGRQNLEELKRQKRESNAKMETNLFSVLRESGGSVQRETLAYKLAMMMTADHIICGSTGTGAIGAEGTAEIWIDRFVREGKLDYCRDSGMVAVVEDAGERARKRLERRIEGKTITRFSPTSITLDDGTVLSWSMEGGQGMQWLVARLDNLIIHQS